MFLYGACKEFFTTLSTVSVKPLPVTLPVSDRTDISILRRSLSLRVIDAGDDEGTMAELYALESPEYSTEALGLHIVASPKHADGIVIVGAITDSMRQAVLDTYEVTPKPCIVIACGDRAIHGDTRFYGAKTATRDILPVDLAIPGNPARAIDIFSYIRAFLHSIPE